MSTKKLLIELIDSSRMDVAVKGNKHDVINMIVIAMETNPEVAEAISEACIIYVNKNKFATLKKITS